MEFDAADLRETAGALLVTLAKRLDPVTSGPLAPLAVEVVTYSFGLSLMPRASSAARSSSPECFSTNSAVSAR